MNCDRVSVLLNGYVDGELDLVTSLDVEEHLQSCNDCSHQQQWLENLHEAASNKSYYYSAPAHLEKRIRSSLRKANPTPSRWPAFSWRWLTPAAVLAVFVFLMVGVAGRGLLVPNQDALIAQEVQTAHVRSLMANHLMDVPSSDMHTVKPWFDGKLNFSPPVPNLAAQGFPLVGGRLDYLDGQPVAALVYQRNKHYINVFVWPAPENSGRPQSYTNNGYHLDRWDAAGMSFWAISDINPEELETFIQAFQSSTK